MLGRLGEDAAHGEAALLQPADEIERFVGGDAAADDEQHAPRAGRGGLRRFLRRRAGRIELRRLVPALLGGRAQDGAHLVFHGAAMAGGAQAQQLFEPLVELADGERGHTKLRADQSLAL